MKWRALIVSVWVAGGFCFSEPIGATLPPFIDVHLFEAYPEIRAVSLQGPFRVIAPIQKTFSGKCYSLIAQNGQVRLRSAPGHPDILHASRITLEALSPAGISLQVASLTPRRYVGTLTLQADRRGMLRIINRMPTRTYVATVIGSETPTGWPLEALKAQAVLTQTRLAAAQSSPHQRGWVGDSTQQEVYLGSAYLRPETRQAADAVWGERLTYNDSPIFPFYHASCAGHTSDGTLLRPSPNAPAQPLPWLTGVRCPYCKMAKTTPFSKPTETRIPAAAFRKAFPSGIPTIRKTDPAGRALLLQFPDGQRETGYQFWIQLGQKLGWDKAPGMRYSISPLANGDVKIRSTGAGHGVGLCQWGAAEQAREGKSYRAILQFYFPKARLTAGK
jgi:stage II sporulation protein D